MYDKSIIMRSYLHQLISIIRNYNILILYKLLPVVGPIVISVAVGAGVERPVGQASVGKNEQAPDVNSISSTAISPV